jgi:hypothetical protein
VDSTFFFQGMASFHLNFHLGTNVMVIFCIN